MVRILVGEISIFAFVHWPALIVSIAAESTLASICAEVLVCAKALASLSLMLCSTCAGINIEKQAGDDSV